MGWTVAWKACRRFDVCRRTLLRWEREGKIRVWRPSGRSVYVWLDADSIGQDRTGSDMQGAKAQTRRWK